MAADMRIAPVPLLLVLLTFAPGLAAAQPSPETLVILRTATDRGTYHLAEVIHQRGRIIPFDLGYIDFDDAKHYREVFLGAGVVAVNHEKLTLITEAFLLKPFGDRAGGALYFEPYFLGIYRVAPRVSAEASYFPYIPLNDAARAQHVLERAKVEYDFGRFTVGTGYGAYKFGDTDWRHKPFVSTTLKAGWAGNFEVWLQRVAEGDTTLQFRYAKLFVH
jgi:hypothetical protein